jgi:hypothetical protein
VGNFDLSVETFKKMQSDGLPEIVILAMFKAKKRKSVILAMVRAPEGTYAL